MNHIYEFVFISGTLIGGLGLLRGMIGARGHEWHARLCAEVDNLTPLDAKRFHEIQTRPRPLVVRINNWLEARHV